MVLKVKDWKEKYKAQFFFLYGNSKTIAVRYGDGKIFKVKTTAYTKFGPGEIDSFSDDLIHVGVRQLGSHEGGYGFSYRVHEFEIKDIQNQRI